MNDYHQATTAVVRGDGSTEKASRSFIKVPDWFFALVADSDSIITGSHIMAFMAVQSHWSPDRPMPWPAMETIAREAGCKVRRAHQLIADIEAVGALRRVSRGRKGGGRGSNRYILATETGPLPIWTDDAPEERQEGPNLQPVAPLVGANMQSVAGELDTQVLEEEPTSQNQEACATASGDTSHENRREPISDPDTIEAARYLSEGIERLSPDIEAATRWAVVQRVISEMGRRGCLVEDLAEPLTTVADTVWDKALTMEAHRNKVPLLSPIGFVMSVAEAMGAMEPWATSGEICSAEYWRVVA